jgi:ubiquinone/menaquinone biosynthesis C-methylase UbiE
MADHREAIEAEFSRQASSFEDRRYSFGDPRVLGWILENVPVEASEMVLDVAGGTGHVARAYAAQALCATVLDLTAEMLEVGKREADAAAVRNVVFQRGEAGAMPFLGDSFDLVISRFAVHHFPDPVEVLSEMNRVCRPAGRVAVMDLIVAEPEHADAYNHRERLRDPSHTQALTLEQLESAMRAAELDVAQVVERDQPIPLERWLAQTQPPEEVAARLRADIEAEISGELQTGMRGHREQDGLYFTQRWAIVVGRPRRRDR